MILSFSELWEKAELFCEKSSPDDTTDEILDPTIMQLTLYKAIDKKEIPIEDRKKIKSRLFGEILFMMTKLSLKDNINVFEALGLSLKDHSVEFYNRSTIPDNIIKFPANKKI
jgi:hypothetical protein